MSLSMGNTSTTRAWNGSSLTMFHLLGFADHPHAGPPLCDLPGHLPGDPGLEPGPHPSDQGDTRLHTPMYFFSATCPSLTSAARLRWLPRCSPTSSGSGRAFPSWAHALLQVLLLRGRGSGQCFLLTAMASQSLYGHPSAPLLLSAVMSQGLCTRLVVGTLPRRLPELPGPVRFHISAPLLRTNPHRPFLL